MTKSAYEAIVAEYGEKICGIHLDNGRIIYVGYRQTDWHGQPIPDGQAKGPTLDDIEVVTYGDEDFLKVTEKMQSQGMKLLDKVSLHPLDNVQCISICDTEGYMLDPYMMN